MCEIKYNLLVIDDEIDRLDVYIYELRKHDINNMIGEIDFIGEFPDKIEEFDIESNLNGRKLEDYHAILLDYDLQKSYHGTLLGAWLMLKNKFIPRIAFASQKYKNEDNRFDESIEKSDFLNCPSEVLNKIIDTIQKFNVQNWLEKNYSEFIKVYSELCNKKIYNITLTSEESNTLETIKSILDSLDKQLDRELEKTIDTRIKMQVFQQRKLTEFDKEIQEIDNELNEVLAKLKDCEG